MDITRALVRHWKPLVAISGLSLAAAAGVICFYPKTWTAASQLILPNSGRNTGTDLGELGAVQETGVAFNNEVNALKVQAAILTSTNVMNSAWQKDPERERFVNLTSYRGLFKVTPQNQSTIMSLEVKGSSPERAMERSRLLIGLYQKRLDELRLSVAMAYDQFGRRELDRAKRELDDASGALSRFKRTTGLVNTDQQTGGLVNVLSTLTASRAQVIAEGRASEVQVQVLSQRLGMSATAAMEALRLGENREYQTLRQKLADVETALAQTRGLYTEKHSKVQALVNQRNELLRSLQGLLSSVVPNAEKIDPTLGNATGRDSRIELILQLLEAERVAQARRQQSVRLGETIDQTSGRLSAISTQQGTLLDLQRRYELAEGVYRGIVAQLQQARLNAFNSFPNIELLDRPYADPMEASPRNLYIALGGALAGIFASLAFLLREQAVNPILGLRDLSAVNLPVLARLPWYREKGEQPIETELEFRLLASTLSLFELENRRLMITSSSAEEGKTTLTAGLAFCLAELGYRVLAVDADFQQAALTARLGQSPRVNNLPQPVPVRENLDLAPALANRDLSPAFFARGSFERYLDSVQAAGELTAREPYDYVLIDSPPLSLTGVTSLIAAAVRNVLFVLREGKSNRDLVNENLQQLSRNQSNIVGLVVNDVQNRVAGRDRYRYRYRYNRNQSEVSP
jgi:uncharacterized protein involved in exopolysaccharide biosynthesis/Mrp family chromosome partitioning ATPase